MYDYGNAKRDNDSPAGGGPRGADIIDAAGGKETKEWNNTWEGGRFLDWLAHNATVQKTCEHWRIDEAIFYVKRSSQPVFLELRVTTKCLGKGGCDRRLTLGSTVAGSVQPRVGKPSGGRAAG